MTKPESLQSARMGKWFLLLTLSGFSVITLLAVIVSLALLLLGSMSIFEGIKIYEWRIGKTTSACSLDKCIKGVEFLLLMPLPIFILKGISFYIQDLLETGKVVRQTKGVFLHIKILMTGLLIGVVSAVLVSEAIQKDLSYGELTLGGAIFLGLVYVYKSLDKIGCYFHRARDVTTSNILDIENLEVHKQEKSPYDKKIWAHLDPKRWWEKTSLIHRLSNSGMRFIWVSGIFLSAILGVSIGFLGLVEICKGSVEVFQDPRSDKAFKSAMALGISGLEFLLLSPLAVFVVDGVRRYFNDLITDGHISQESRDGLLEVKVLLTGLLLSIIATEMVGMTIRSSEVKTPQIELTQRYEQISHEKDSVIVSFLLSDNPYKNPEKEQINFEDFFCNFTVLILLGFYYLKLVRHDSQNSEISI